MLLIIATQHINLDAINNLLQQYDTATDDADRDRIAEDLKGLIGPRTRSLIQRQLRAFDLGADELDSLTTEAIRAALSGAGRTRLRRTDIIPERLIEQMRTSAQGQQLWALLSDPLRTEISGTTYIKADLAQKLTNEINALLENAEFASRMGFDTPETDSVIERSYGNATALASAFPEALRPVEKPDAHLLGFLEKSILPTLAGRVKRERGEIPPEIVRVWRSIKPTVEELRAASGGAEPTPQEVQQAHRQRLGDLYGPRLQWWHQQLEAVGRPFRISSPGAYSDAKEILLDNGYEPKLWDSSDAPQYLSKEFLKPVSKMTIERAMRSFAPASTAASSSPTWYPSPAPAAPPEPSGPSWALELGQQGRGGDLYRAIVEALYPDASSVERQVGEFVALNPNPSSEAISSFLDRLEPDIAEHLRSSWRDVVHGIDRAVIDVVRDRTRAGEIAQQFGYSPAQLEAMRHDARRLIFARTTRLIVTAA